MQRAGEIVIKARLKEIGKKENNEAGVIERMVTIYLKDKCTTKSVFAKHFEKTRG